jgi:hypothetical protein
MKVLDLYFPRCGKLAHPGSVILKAVFPLGGDLPIDGDQARLAHGYVEHPRSAPGQSPHPSREVFPKLGLDVGQVI